MGGRVGGNLFYDWLCVNASFVIPDVHLYFHAGAKLLDLRLGGIDLSLQVPCLLAQGDQIGILHQALLKERVHLLPHQAVEPGFIVPQAEDLGLKPHDSTLLPGGLSAALEKVAGETDRLFAQICHFFFQVRHCVLRR